MSEVNHIHQVLFWLQEQNTPILRSQFVTNLNEAFGSETSFRSCSESKLQGEGVLDFLLTKKKIVESDGLIDLHPQLKICNGHLS